MGNNYLTDHGFGSEINGWLFLSSAPNFLKTEIIFQGAEDKVRKDCPASKLVSTFISVSCWRTGDNLKLIIQGKRTQDMQQPSCCYLLIAAAVLFSNETNKWWIYQEIKVKAVEEKTSSQVSNHWTGIRELVNGLGIQSW